MPDKKCTLCSANNNLITVFKNNLLQRGYLRKIVEITLGLQLKPDDLVCLSCIIHSYNFYVFIVNVKNCQERFQVNEVFNNRKLNNSSTSYSNQIRLPNLEELKRNFVPWIQSKVGGNVSKEDSDTSKTSKKPTTEDKAIQTTTRKPTSEDKAVQKTTEKPLTEDKAVQFQEKKNKISFPNEKFVTVATQCNTSETIKKPVTEDKAVQKTTKNPKTKDKAVQLEEQKNKISSYKISATVATQCNITPETKTKLIPPSDTSETTKKPMTKDKAVQFDGDKKEISSCNKFATIATECNIKPETKTKFIQKKVNVDEKGVQCVQNSTQNKRSQVYLNALTCEKYMQTDNELNFDLHQTEISKCDVTIQVDIQTVQRESKKPNKNFSLPLKVNEIKVEEKSLFIETGEEILQNENIVLSPGGLLIPKKNALRGRKCKECDHINFSRQEQIRHRKIHLTCIHCKRVQRSYKKLYMHYIECDRKLKLEPFVYMGKRAAVQSVSNTKRVKYS